MRPPLRGLLFGAVAFTFGILLAPFGPDPAIRLLICILFLIASVIAVSIRSFAFSAKTVLILLWLAIGWTRAAPANQQNLPDDRVWIEGTVRIPVENTAGGTRLRLGGVSWSAGSQQGYLRGGALAVVDGDGSINAGDRVRLIGRIEHMPGPRNPGDFNARAYWGMRGVQFRIRSIRELERIESGGLLGSFASTIASARETVKSVVSRNMTPATEPLARALMTGDRADWDRGLRDRIAASGLMHLFAISGLHVGLIALIAHGLLSLTGLGHKTRILK